MPKRRDDPEDEDYYDEDRPRRKGGAVSHVVPFRNPCALAGYYCGFVALLPAIGILLGPLATLLGVIGFIKARENPQAHGTGHAITGVILGLAGFLMCQPFWLVIGIYALNKQR
jgi:uncharacterized protein YqgC (DUF456 family)